MVLALRTLSAARLLASRAHRNQEPCADRSPHRGGLRISEALALEPRDVDAAGGMLNVRHGKGDRQRLVGLDPAALALLERWLDRRAALGLARRRRERVEVMRARRLVAHPAAVDHRSNEPRDLERDTAPPRLPHNFRRILLTLCLGQPGARAGASMGLRKLSDLTSREPPRSPDEARSGVDFGRSGSRHQDPRSCRPHWRERANGLPARR
ncbi:MAG: tyrosine-type recombinase/integrase [Actinomycetota bacterium]|nr:tyrosine-type recombinase/integrase [Actinomycetota bacterium]